MKKRWFLSCITKLSCAVLSFLVMSDSLSPHELQACQAPLSMEILQVRIMKWVAMHSSRGSSQPKDQTQVSHIAGRLFTIWDTREFWLPGSSVHGILQARILEWVAIPFSRGSSQPRDWTQVSCIAGGFFIIWATREDLNYLKYSL